MHWNYRIVFMEDERWGDQWMELREVFYNDAGEPIGHSSTTVIGDSLDDVAECLRLMQEAVEKPVLKHADFIGKFVDLDKDEEKE